MWRLTMTPVDVRQHIDEYLKKNYPEYVVHWVVRKTNDKRFRHLHMVAAMAEDETFTVWTLWNDKERTLEFPHYKVADYEGIKEIFTKYFYYVDNN